VGASRTELGGVIAKTEKKTFKEYTLRSRKKGESQEFGFLRGLWERGGVEWGGDKGMRKGRKSGREAKEKRGKKQDLYTKPGLINGSSGEREEGDF